VARLDAWARAQAKAELLDRFFAEQRPPSFLVTGGRWFERRTAHHTADHDAAATAANPPAFRIAPRGIPCLL